MLCLVLKYWVKILILQFFILQGFHNLVGVLEVFYFDCDNQTYKVVKTLQEFMGELFL
ncbi:hypothetical protein D3C80_2018710 [compost metagenome]